MRGSVANLIRSALRSRPGRLGAVALLLLAVAAIALPDPYRKCIPLLKQWCHRRVDTSAPITVANPSNAAQAEHAAYLHQRSDGFLQMHQHRVSKDGVEGAIGKGQAVDICNLEARVHHPLRNT